jgi:hypothetical protein
MSIQAMAEELVALCREGKYHEVYDKFFHPNAYSEEPVGDNPRVEGVEAILKKGEWWSENFDVHGGSVSDPQVADNYFTVAFSMDVTNKQTGERTQDTEIALYEVKDGKIAGERFFY